MRRDRDQTGITDHLQRNTQHLVADHFLFSRWEYQYPPKLLRSLPIRHDSTSACGQHAPSLQGYQRVEFDFAARSWASLKSHNVSGDARLASRKLENSSWIATGHLASENKGDTRGTLKLRGYYVIEQQGNSLAERVGFGPSSRVLVSRRIFRYSSFSPLFIRATARRKLSCQ
jgi:hypothetical protein